MSEMQSSEEQWIAKYRAAMDAFAQREENSWSIRNFISQLRVGFRRAFPPNVDRLKPVTVANGGTSKVPRELQSRKHGTFS